MTEMTIQLAVFLKNVPGALHAMLESLAERGINVEGLMVSDAADHAVVRLVLDQPQKAIHLLEDRGAVVVESEVLCHTMENRPGMLLDLAGKLARHKVNIAYLYGSTPGQKAAAGDARARIFIHTSDNARVKKLLASGSGKAARASGRAAARTGRRR